MASQPELSSRTGRYVEQDGLRFRDLDGDGVLSPYEDWRLSPAERAQDLVARMNPEEKCGLMIIGSHYPGYSEFLPHAKEGQLLNSEDVWRDANPITGQQYPEPVLVTSSTDNAINVRHQRFLISRDNLAPKDLATWTNAVQEVAEKSRLGIPVVFASNPRNHVALVATFGVNESSGIFSEWPGEIGLAALKDPELMETFGRGLAREWRAAGIHKMYGYMADVASEPRWSRFNGTFGEDPVLVSDYMTSLVKGMQGEGVGFTVKHFPGGGVRFDGHDPHFEWGQTNEYPTEDALYTYHMPPFQAAIDAGAYSVMPYYAKPVNESAPQLPKQHWVSETEQFDELAFAYSSVFMQKILRDDMGLRGYINSDSGIIDAMPWGVEELTKPERFAAAVKAGTDIFSDMADPRELIKAYEQGLLEEKYLDQACARLLEEIFTLGLFENPYVDEDAAEKIVGNEQMQALGEKAQRDSVTLLRNSEGILPLEAEASISIFAYVTGRTKPKQVQQQLEEAIAKVLPNAKLVPTAEEADLAIVWARPEINLFEDDKEGVSLSIDPRDNGVEVDRILHIEREAPTILAVNLINPWLLGEIEPNATALVATFEITPEQLLRSLTGEDGGPKGTLPLTPPASMKVVADSGRDVPGKFLGEEYAYTDRDGTHYVYGFGQSL